MTTGLAPTASLEDVSAIARDPRGYVADWRTRHPGRAVLAVLPMNFPRELVHAAGALPVVVQDDGEPIGEGRALLPEFYCGYTRNLVDQAAAGRFVGYDAVLMADHCIQLVGAADVVRAIGPDVPVYFGMLNSSMNDPWGPARVLAMIRDLKSEVEARTATTISDDALRASVTAHNAVRSAVRALLDERAAGRPSLTPAQLQDVVAAAMIADPVEYAELLVRALPDVPRQQADDRVRVHLSGHLCHAPRRDLLAAIEDSGARVVDDDLYHGRRHVSTDVRTDGDPVEALAQWYVERNTTIPCPTRVQQDADWDSWLLGAVRRSHAEAVVHLLPKFCEPHMLYYPELRKALDAAGVPQLLVETEHEGLPLEAVRTRVEALVERVRRSRTDDTVGTGGQP